ncbi:MAG: 2-C-methyl-D-erythritol 4-phosphate cytidylyltransferase [Spirochaetaceae bacterium]|nr:2-C-methyl-D-erythritol 4-phosphate cytidylyltransferase [Spirochaetaceae bacterium]
MKNYAIILSSGSGERTGLNQPKQFHKIAGKTIIEHTLDSFERHNQIDAIILVVAENYYDYHLQLITAAGYQKVIKVVCGGNSRQQSSYHGLMAINETEALVLIHDAVRPFIQSTTITNVIEALTTYNAVDTALPSPDTLIEVDGNGFIKAIPPRKYFMRGQTPQGFKLSLIKKAHQLANQEGNTTVTDDCGLIYYYKLASIKVVAGDDFNHKITYPVDVALADKLFQLKSVSKLNSQPEFLTNALTGKVIAIFGAGSGIGEACLKLATHYGAKVYGFDKNSADITNEAVVTAAINNIIQQEGRLDGVIVTAAVLNMGALNGRSLSSIEQEIKLNYLANIIVAKASYTALSASKGCLIMFTSSSYTRGRALYGIYSSVKAAIVNLTQALAEEWLAAGIRVNVINPERTQTAMRLKNFGNEDPVLLLSADKVAQQTLATLANNSLTGQVVDVTKK